MVGPLEVILSLIIGTFLFVLFNKIFNVWYFGCAAIGSTYGVCVAIASQLIVLPITERFYNIPNSISDSFVYSIDWLSKYWYVILILFVISLFFKERNNMQDGEYYINLIKNGHPIEYPEITYNDAFQNAFSDGKWIFVRTQDNVNTVEFSGVFKNKDENCEMKFQFVIHNESSFTIAALMMNDILQDENALIKIHNSIFNSYVSKAPYCDPTNS